MEATWEHESYFLGLDCSTQSLKATVLCQTVEAETGPILKVITTEVINFDSHLPQYGTINGVHTQRLPSPHTEAGRESVMAHRVTSPTLMWVEALDLLLDSLKRRGFPFDRVSALSGSGQQHGSVYWKRGALSTLKSLQASSSLTHQLKGCFSNPSSPVWMDNSTGDQCRAIEESVGGAAAMSAVTGSRVYPRFTAAQIRRFYETDKMAYSNTERISLVSSFMASLLIGEYAGIDYSDGAGMNLMDVQSKQWWKTALEATAPDLDGKLGELVPSHSVAGFIHSFFVNKYGFSDSCLVISWSGDNPCSLAGLGIDHVGDVGISLGTSDTVFGVVEKPQLGGSHGHVFPNPVDPNSYMIMLCYANGSLTRQAVRDKSANGSWQQFDAILKRSQPLNGGHFGLYFSVPEIQPAVPAGFHRFKLRTHGNFVIDEDSVTSVDTFEDEYEVRAIIEGQMASIRGHSQRLGIPIPPRRVLATGGGSASHGILSTMAAVLQCDVYPSNQTDSASLGGALRAVHGWMCHVEGTFVPYSLVLGLASMPSLSQKICRVPDFDVYEKFVQLRMKIEDQIAS